MSRPRFDPAAYPGARPAGPALVYRGQVVPLRLDGPLPAPFRLVPDAAAATDEGGARAGGRASLPVVEVPRELRWSVAYGSNASPARLADKGLDVDGAVLLPARIAGWVPAFEARRTGYGAVPLTLVPQPGAVSETWLLGLPPQHLDELDRTEGRVADRDPVEAEPAGGDPVVRDAAAGVPVAGDPVTGDPVAGDTARYAPPGTYRLGRVGEVAVADRFVVRGALAYLPGPATVVQHTGTAWRSWPEHDQAMAARALDDPPAGEVTRTAPQAAPVLGPWPDTPLEDLPLFVYGTLRPGASAWGRIRDLVEVTGPATTTGQLWDTGNGWPALTAGPDEDVHGMLLVARDAGEAAELLALTDAYEGVPELFRRVAVRVRAGSARGEGWAATYVWAAADPPGAPVTTGRWERS